MSATDLFRLLLIPAFGYIAYTDFKTRRVPTRIWYPLLGVGVVLLAWDLISVLDNQRRFWLLSIRTAISLGLLVPLAYGFHRIVNLGMADVKALAVIGLWFPTYPEITIGGMTMPLFQSQVGVLSIAILLDAAVLGGLYPVGLLVRNGLTGNIARAMVIGRPYAWHELGNVHGTLLDETGERFSGLDLDALRMYLRWRDISLGAVRKRADELRDPATVSGHSESVTDGRVDPTESVPKDVSPATVSDQNYDDPWGAAAFLAAIPGGAYGTTPASLRRGLDLVATADRVWVMPNLPFLVFLAAGLLVGLVVGDLLVAISTTLGLS